MSQRPNPSPSSFMRNLTAGSYGPVRRVRVMLANIAKKRGGAGCCGQYGEPGC